MITHIICCPVFDLVGVQIPCTLAGFKPVVVVAFAHKFTQPRNIQNPAPVDASSGGQSIREISQGSVNIPGNGR
jgi:hypothetical protein